MDEANLTTRPELILDWQDEEVPDVDGIKVLRATFRSPRRKIATTSVAVYEVWPSRDGVWHFSKGWRGYFDYEGNAFDTQLDAMKACEVDYLAMCGEFAGVYNRTTHVAISKEMAEAARKAMCFCYDQGLGDELARFVNELEVAMIGNTEAMTND